MSAKGSRFILASASPRRREILSTLGIHFDVVPSLVDESTLDFEGHVEFVREVALSKLQNVLERTTEQGAYVLAADTIVCAGAERFGKPRDDDDARAMLKRLAGAEHVVRTAIALGRVGDGVLGAEVVKTRVWFAELSETEVTRYVATGEGRDKAGAYAVQGLASGFVTRIEGSYTNVVGLPAREVIGLLLRHGAMEQWP